MLKLTRSPKTRGEKTADALESNLSNLEKKLDDLLASFEEAEHSKVEEANPSTSSSSDGKTAGGGGQKS